MCAWLRRHMGKKHATEIGKQHFAMSTRGGGQKASEKFPPPHRLPRDRFAHWRTTLRRARRQLKIEFAELKLGRSMMRTPTNPTADCDQVPGRVRFSEHRGCK